MTKAIADTSVFIALEQGRRHLHLPEQLAVSVVTAAELELGVLRAKDARTRAARLATLGRVRSLFELLPIDGPIASSFARIASDELATGRKLRQHDTWIAATALSLGVPVVTQDADFSSFSEVDVIRV